MPLLKLLAKIVIAILAFFVVLTLTLWLIKTPTNDSDWEFGQQKLQQVLSNKDSITVKDLRDYNWTNKGQEENYTDLTFTLQDIQSLEVGESHFSIHEGIGHVFLIFNLKDGRNVALSIESRRDKNEEFEIIKGLIFDYELIYILATKEDLLSLRKMRDERVYIYPIKTTPEKAQKLFQLVGEKVNSLYEKPEFYHLFFKNCTNLITKEVEKISDTRFPFYEKTFAPGYAGRALFKMGLIETDLKDFTEVQDRYLIKFPYTSKGITPPFNFKT
ncbi:hypothetical protein COU74_00805 [Candidatus Peregrinibacteria bacterium CG10_big_fil_rev_8_21_14_0_10_36_19]|nr:MAG: hypothetical protein COU74_00805 [Candidatus Peregrinibacteria bacterium CG10_big_fil_rev_8_21_14_0_10_36_19]